jgi:hypothetical protein
VGRLLADDGPVYLTQCGPDLVLTLAKPLDAAFAPVVSIGGQT